MSSHDIYKGTKLAPDEAIVWQGRPSWRGIVRDVMHLRGVAAYMAFLVFLDAYQAWVRAVPFRNALYDSVPIAVIVGIVSGNIIGIGWLMGRATRFTITDRRVILDYGIAIPATLSLPFSRLQSVAVTVGADHTGDIVLKLKPSEHMPFLKLWPYTRAWHVTHPQPMLRCVPQAAVIAGLLARVLSAAEARSVPSQESSESTAKSLAA